MTDHIGRQLGNYRLLRLLGQGGFAEVYLGEHVRLGMKAAVKVLHANLVGEEIEAFQREARIIAELEHPHIVRVLDFDVQNRIPFLVLDYAPNGSLREKHPRGKPVPLALVAQYVEQVASALQYAHDHKLIHRDVKPENMLLGKQGEVRLSDFGIAAVAHSTSSMNTQVTTGTLAYMAPEQIQGKPRPASDQYALAVTIYQWLSGEWPFQGSSTEIIAQHLMVAPPSLGSKASSVSPDLEEVVMMALVKDPRDRFNSVQAFATALIQASETNQASLKTLLPASTPNIPPTLPARAFAPATAPVLAPLPPIVPDTLPANKPENPIRVSTPAWARHDEERSTSSTHAPVPVRNSSRWRTWLIGAAIIAVLAVVVALVIPVLRLNNGNHTRTVPCSVGTDYDLNTGQIIGKSSTFAGTVTLDLVCTFPADFFTNTYQLSTQDVYEQWTISTGRAGGGGRGMPSAQIDATHYIYFDPHSFSSPGSYTWSVSSPQEGQSQAPEFSGSIQFTLN